MTEDSIKEKVWRLLTENPLLKPLQICSILHLNKKDYQNYVTKLRSQWKSYSKNEQVSKRLSFHNWHGWVYVPKGTDRGAAVGVGWVLTKAKNKWLLWKERGVGRLEWHTSGRVKIWVRKPANLGKMSQLLANAFHMTALIPDIRVFEMFRKSARLKGAHAVLELGERLPYVSVDFLEKSNGVKIKLGDITHPTSLEVEFHYPDYAEKCEAALLRLAETFDKLFKIDGEKPSNHENKNLSYRI